MKANEFVKKYGWDHTKLHIENMEAVQIGNNHQEYIDSLKNLVNAYELVESLGGLQECYKHIEGKFIRVGDWNFIDIKQAIELVESVK